MLRSETAGHPDRTATALRGLRLYQEADRVAGPARTPIIARVGRASVRDYGGANDRGAPAVLFVPSLINPPDVLDIDERRSLLAGWRPGGCARCCWIGASPRQERTS